jgi:hypothetical protein
VLHHISRILGESLVRYSNCISHECSQYHIRVKLNHTIGTYLQREKIIAIKYRKIVHGTNTL